MSRRNEAKARTRDAVLAAAAALFRSKGFRHTSIRLIATYAGYSTGAVFACYSGKDELWRAVTGTEPPDLALWPGPPSSLGPNEVRTNETPAT